MEKFLTLIFLLLLIIGCNQEENTKAETAVTEMTTTESMAKHYGIDAWENVKRLQFSFVVNSPERTYERKWEWFPHMDSIVFYSDSVVSYKRAELDTSDAAMVNIDKRFINDSYWLLFPFQVYWSEVDIMESPEEKAPISGRLLKKVVIQFGDKGYTPRDVYDLYLDEQHQIVEWVFKRGGSQENPSPMTWEGHEKFGPLLISTIHKTPEGSPRIVFKDIEVEMKE